MTRQRCLIVNADDFGQSRGVNRGVIEAHERGIVTSASLMVRWPPSAEAASYGRKHRDLSLGLHFDLGEWAYRDGAWVEVYGVVPVEDVTAVSNELSQQLATFRRLVGQAPSHVDSHQHVHRQEPVRRLLIDAADKLRIPLRECGPKVGYCGDFYGQTGDGFPFPETITVDRLVRILANLPVGFTELGCHPGVGNDLDTMYRGERVEELRVLCDAEVRAGITALGVELRSFHDVAEAGQSAIGAGLSCHCGWSPELGAHVHPSC